MTEKDFKTLQEHIDKLKRLLDDPQPGLFSWNEMLNRRMQTISDLWNIHPPVTHCGYRVETRGRCATCRTPTNWIAPDFSAANGAERTYWCGCGN